MLTIWGRRRDGHCGGIPRRDFIKSGLLGISGLTLADVLRIRAEANAAGRPADNKSVILF